MEETDEGDRMDDPSRHTHEQTRNRSVPGQRGPKSGSRKARGRHSEHPPRREPSHRPAHRRPDYGPEKDPVKEVFGGEFDLYGIASWEPRGAVDRIAVGITRVLGGIKSRLLVSVALTLFLTQMAVAGMIVLREPVVGVFAVLSAVPALVITATLWYWDPTHREPLQLVAVTFLLSMLFASFAAVINTLLKPLFAPLGAVGLVLFFFLVVAPGEEFVKWLAIRVRAYRSQSFRTVIDGAVYGAIAGLGFAAIENFVYITSSAISPEAAGTQLQLQYAATTAATRAFVGPGHVVFSAWAGFYLGLAKFNPRKKAPIVVKGLLIAAFIHACYNSLVGIVPAAVFALFGIPQVVGFVSFVILFHAFWFGLLYRKILRYRTLYRRIGQNRRTR